MGFDGFRKITIEAVDTVDDELRDLLLDIDEEAFGSGSLNEWSFPPFLHHGRVYLARLDGEPVGMAELMRDWNDPQLAYLYGYAVLHDCQGSGIGTELLSFILSDISKKGFKRLQLTVHPENHMALHIYEAKFGMQRVMFIPDYYGVGEDRWMMEWRAE